MDKKDDPAEFRAREGSRSRAVKYLREMTCARLAMMHRGQLADEISELGLYVPAHIRPEWKGIPPGRVTLVCELNLWGDALSLRRGLLPPNSASPISTAAEALMGYPMVACKGTAMPASILPRTATSTPSDCGCGGGK